MTRVLFGVLALFDAALLATLASRFGWWTFSTPREGAGLLVAALFTGVAVAARLFAASFGLAVAAGIVVALGGDRAGRSKLAIPARLLLLIALIGLVFAWTNGVASVFEAPPGFSWDRLSAFDRLARKIGADARDILGIASYQGGSAGAYLFVLLETGYLAEKYLLGWWRVRWPLPVLPLVALASLALMVRGGEREQRAFVAAQEWRALPEPRAWLDAIDGCRALGPGWRLPSRQELSLYLAAQPNDGRAGGFAWTASVANGGYAIGVDLQPRRAAGSDEGSELPRDQSPCEVQQQPDDPSDWFAALRPRVCAIAGAAPDLYTAGLKPLAEKRGPGVAMTQAESVCINPLRPVRLAFRGRQFPQERSFSERAEFSAFMAEECRQQPDRNRVGCFAFASQRPDFEETDDEQGLRGFCELDRKGESCYRYALLMDARRGQADRSHAYRLSACERGYPPACDSLEPGNGRPAAIP